MSQSIRVSSFCDQQSLREVEGERRINRRNDLPIVITRLIKQPVAKKRGTKCSRSRAWISTRLLNPLFDLYDRYGVYGGMGEGCATGQAKSRRVHFPSDLASKRRHRVRLLGDTGPG